MPLRIEVGPRDADAGVFVLASRLGGDKEVCMNTFLRAYYWAVPACAVTVLCCRSGVHVM